MSVIYDPILGQLRQKDASDIPTAVSELNNDAGYQTASDVATAVSGKLDNPVGGTAGQVLTKTASGTEWADASGGVSAAYVNNIHYMQGTPAASEIWYYAPEQVTLYSSTNVNSHTYADGKGILTIKSSVTQVGNWFRERNTITSVKIGANFKTFYSRAFADCTSLQNVVMPNSVTSIVGYTFQNCTSLQNIVIPDGVTSIDNYTFQNCTSLRNVVIPNGVTSIGLYAFDGCASLQNVVIPNSVTSIANFVFSYCSSLTQVVIPNGVTSISSSAFRDCTSLRNVVIPDGVTSIADFAFSGCALRNVAIPNSVTSIGGSAFKNSVNLTEIYCGFASGVVSGAPWGAPSTATVHYNSYKVNPDDKPYTCNVPSALTIYAGTSSDIAYAELVLDVASGASVTADSSITFVDEPEAGKRNVCIVRWQGGAAKLYVTMTENLPVA